jgi:hypothetical protein
MGGMLAATLVGRHRFDDSSRCSCTTASIAIARVEAVDLLQARSAR